LLVSALRPNEPIQIRLHNGDRERIKDSKGIKELIKKNKKKKKFLIIYSAHVGQEKKINKGRNERT
jgi:hypothetical protein